MYDDALKRRRCGTRDQEWGLSPDSAADNANATLGPDWDDPDGNVTLKPAPNAPPATPPASRRGVNLTLALDLYSADELMEPMTPVQAAVPPPPHWIILHGKPTKSMMR